MSGAMKSQAWVIAAVCGVLVGACVGILIGQREPAQGEPPPARPVEGPTFILLRNKNLQGPAVVTITGAGMHRTWKYEFRDEREAEEAVEAVLKTLQPILRRHTDPREKP